MHNENKIMPAGKIALHAIEQLVLFALRQQLIAPSDEDYSRNVLLEQFGFSEPLVGDIDQSALEERRLHSMH